MTVKTDFPVNIWTKSKILNFQAISVELEVQGGQIVILYGHVPIIGTIDKSGQVTIRELSGATTVFRLPDGLFVLDHNCSLSILKTDE